MSIVSVYVMYINIWYMHVCDSLRACVRLLGKQDVYQGKQNCNT